MYRRALCWVAALWLVACGGAPDEFTTHHGNLLSVKEVLANHKATVLLFLAPKCPLCENYAPLMQTWPEGWSQDSVAVLGVVSGTYYSTQTIEKYLRQHQLNFPVVVDHDFQLAKRYGASITPEVVLLSPQAEVQYKGAIDNWAISLGKKRLRPTAHYLNDALAQFLSGNEIKIKETQAIGCFIE